ncbi:MAG: hypothetical protein EXR71_04370 [Myxococcales bacterium]|nr:hypothetical protein [Myxococcales bacterium]
MVLILHVLTACTGDDGSVVAAPLAPASVSPDLVAATWQVRMANATARAPFEGRQSWVAWYETRRPDALAAFASESDPTGLARAHAEYSAIYRQATLLASNAILQVYGADLQSSDPAEAAYLLGVSGVFAKRPEYAERLGQSGQSAVAEVARRDASWKEWAAAAVGLPDGPAASASVQGRPGELPLGGFAPFQLTLVGAPGSVSSADPGDLFALARWHEARAREADPASSAVIDQFLNPFRLPMETRVSDGEAVASDTWLFMSAYTSGADMLFSSLVAQGNLPGAEALTGQSAYAAIAKGCATTDKVDVDCVIEQSARFGMAIEAAMASHNGGAADGFHRPFSNYARAGALRALDLYARARGEDQASGILRINAYDRNIDNAIDPVFILFLAAWDAGNRNTTRATELVHQNLRQVPGLELARAPLDALHVRLSRNAAPGVPTH